LKLKASLSALSLASMAPRHRYSALVCLFAITEKVREVGRREVKEYSWTKTVIDYEGTGLLEFRADDYVYGRKFRDSKRHRLESLITQCVGALMREGRARKIQAEDARIREIERQKKQAELWELSRQIDEEEKKVKDLNTWVDDWARARQVREFVAELQKVWAQEGNDLSAEAPKGQRIAWMKQQADRLDPMIPSPPSILDRNGELRGW
jgi:hypothetical protein